MKRLRHGVSALSGLGLAFVAGTLLSAQVGPQAPEKADVKPALDGVVSPIENEAATRLLNSDPAGEALLTKFGGELSSWSAVEIDGQFSGAFAEIKFAEPVFLDAPPVIRAANREASEEAPDLAVSGGDVPQAPREYVLERATLGPTEVDRYGVFVDLDSMRILHLAPMAETPRLSEAPPSVGADRSPHADDYRSEGK